MKVRITEPGWAGYTGRFGAVDFEDGVSVGDVDVREAYFLSTIVQVEGTKGEDLTELMNARLGQIESAPIEVVLRAEQAPTPAVAEGEKFVLPEGVTITREYLESVADKKGIKGLREIGKPLGVSNTSISGLIDEILAAVTPKVAAGMLAEGA